ncbi:hypothetical protein C0581_00595 [Candidatus Parcubacteria bacterium]|nr:MAG: hypothetical protein C0581_00595 [Candidatus Parcubacteria bacterium]
MKNWDIKTQMLQAIEEKGGFVNCHAHFDKAFYISKEGMTKSMLDMEAKWQMSDETKRNDSGEDVANRIRRALDMMIEQGVKLTLSFIDGYSAVGQKAIDAALIVQEEYRDKIRFLTSTQPIGGLLDPKERRIFEIASSKADTVGGLPSRDRPYMQKSFDIMFNIARNENKPLHVHIDQENNPHERDTEMLLYYTKKYGYEGRVVAIHALSTAAQPKKYREKLYKHMADLGIHAVVCPSAAISMRQLDQYNAPVHNSIANVPEMIEAGVVVGLGNDDLLDFYEPLIDGDMWVELRFLMEACRYYNFDEAVKIATTNGQKILSIT